MWSPVYYYLGNLFVYTSVGFRADNEHTAKAIGSLATTEATFTGQALDVNVPGQRYVPGTLNGLPVAVLSGPIFTQAAAAKAA